MSLGLSLSERFIAKIDTSGECWLWTGAKGRDGYGLINSGVRGVPVRASRVSLSLALGRPLKAGMDALHSCDTPACVKPDHLFEGTDVDNHLDMTKKGRGVKTKPRTSLTQRKAMLEFPAVSIRDMAALLGCGGETVARIRRQAGVISTAKRGAPKKGHGH